MKSLRSKQFVYSAISALICLLVLIYSTYAWISNNRSVDSTGMQLEAGNLVQNATIASYPVTRIAGNNYTFEPTIQKEELPPFDRYQIEHSDFEKALVVHIQFQSSDATFIDLTALAESSVFPSFLATSTWDTAVEGYISDVLQIQLATVDGKTATASGAPFQFTDGTAQKTTELLLLQNETMTDSNDIYLILTYNTTAVNYICGNAHNTIHYSNDISFRIDGKGGNK